MDDSTPAAEAVVRLAEEHLGRGEPLLAYNALQEGLARFPEHLRMRQLQALALARSGDTARANAALASLNAAGAADAETVGMLARTHKDLALASAKGARRDAHLAAAFDLYGAAYDRARRDASDDSAWYTGINAATIAVLQGDLPRARGIAHQVREICRRTATSVGGSSAAYWRAATLGEASIILGEVEAARTHYREAMAIAGSRYGDVSSTRRQAKLLARHLPDVPDDFVATLCIPPVVVYSGHMIDRPDRAVPRFPPSLEPAVRGALRERLAAIAPLAVYGSAACGADLICLEIARELGSETHIVLPFPPHDFVRTSVESAGPQWRNRFDDALAAADSVTITSDHHARGSTATFDYANLVLTGMGALRAQLLDAPLRALALRDPNDTGDAGGGTSSIVRRWRERGLDVEEVPLAGGNREAATPLDEESAQASTPSVARHELRAMLFADAVGYSKLGEDQIPGYIEGFLGSVAALSRASAHPFEHVETSGDGLYMVFRNAADAGHFALELSEMTNAFDRAAWGLPSTFNLRVALHCGPVHCATDPITGAPLYTGPHTSRAARIEPVTPPGQVYASSAFAAVVAASGGDFDMRYVGRMPLAKGYGSLGLYHLAPRAKILA